jgi:hypothetical protein
MRQADANAFARAAFDCANAIEALRSFDSERAQLYTGWLRTIVAIGTLANLETLRLWIDATYRANVAR